jgi:diguanylate cyclase (GGDEF)-like protein/PAS domain S-box-containing protein
MKGFAAKAGVSIGCIFLGLAAMLATGPLQAQDLHGKRALLLYSYHPTFPTAEPSLKGIRSVIAGTGLQLDIEYMDSKRLYDAYSVELFRARIAYQLSNRAPYDVVFSADDNALNFLLRFGDELMPRVPIVFFGVNDLVAARGLNDSPNVTGVVEAASFDATLKLARSLFPARDALYVIVDGTPTGQSDLREVRALASRYPATRIEEISLSELDWASFRERIAAIDEHGFILLLAAYRDRLGQSKDFSESLALIRHETDAPIMHLWEHGIGEGVLGGVVVSFEEQGRQAALAALKILRGTAPAKIPVVEQSPNVPMFDYALLDHYGLDRGDLPLNARVLNLPLGFWSQYRQRIMIAAAIIVGVIAILLAIISQLYRTKSALGESEKRYRNIVETSQEGILLVDTRDRITFANEKMGHLLGYHTQSLEGRSFVDLVHAGDRDEALVGIRDGSDRTGQQDLRLVRADGSAFWARLAASRIRDEQGEPAGALAMVTDIDPLKRSQDHLDFLAHHDALTGLPNRLLLLDRLRHALERSRRTGEMLAVIFFDLDGFKGINDSLGHSVGDQLLTEIGHRLRERLRTSDTLGRLGGDEFLILMESGVEEGGPSRVAESVLRLLAEPIAIDGNELYISASIGISHYPRDGQDAEALLRCADLAMYRAKSDGRNCYRYFEPEIRVRAVERHGLANALRGALHRGELTVHYQPQVRLPARQLHGIEALARWDHPQLGMVPPGRFIPIAEELGLINDIGQWVLTEACRQMMRWRDAGLHIPRVAVNCSMQQVDAEHLLPTVQAVLEQTGLPASDLELEVTESMLMGRDTRALLTLDGLHALGVMLSVDDFGTGYSALGRLNQLPIDRLKIDRSFIAGIGTDKGCESIVRAIIGLASDLGLEIIAEGVEREHQVQFLIGEHCLLAQGWLFGKAVPAEAIAEYVLFPGACTG